MLNINDHVSYDPINIQNIQTVVVNFDNPLDWVLSRLRDIFLGVSVGMFTWGGKTHPKYGVYHPMGWGPRLIQQAEGQNSLLSSLNTDAMWPAASLSCHQAFPTMTVRELRWWAKQPFLPQAALGRHFVTATREVAQHQRAQWCSPGSEKSRHAGWPCHG